MNPVTQTPSVAEIVIFAILAGAVAVGALFTITRRNPVAAVMSLVGTFFALAGIYASLSAHFLAVMQVAVYAGAIMVLFIFVIMILNREEIEPVSFKGIITRAIGVVAGGYTMLVLARVVWSSRAGAFGQAPKALDDSFGTVQAVGASLFREFVFPFEAVSLLLLVAIVGGVIVSRSQKQEEQAEEQARHEAMLRAAISNETRLTGPVAEGHGAHDDHSHAPAHH